jgi:hypothetical protein
MKKRVLLSLVLLAIAGVSMVFAQAPTLDKLSFTENPARTEIQVKAANNSISGAVVIPNTYDAFKDKFVGQINMNAFRDITGITSVFIPNSVKVINQDAFKGCTGLSSVIFQSADVSINFPNDNFPGDLAAKYRAGGAGTYTRPRESNTWTKQGGAQYCLTCGQPLP